eukprot:scaffold4998_cov120-Isochrysis_galbana.AAC.3
MADASTPPTALVTKLYSATYWAPSVRPARRLHARRSRRRAGKMDDAETRLSQEIHKNNYFTDTAHTSTE